MEVGIACQQHVLSRHHFPVSDMGFGGQTSYTGMELVSQPGTPTSQLGFSVGNPLDPVMDDVAIRRKSEMQHPPPLWVGWASLPGYLRQAGDWDDRCLGTRSRAQGIRKGIPVHGGALKDVVLVAPTTQRLVPRIRLATAFNLCPHAH